MSDLVGVWEVSLSDGMHMLEFEHGTTSGKRIIRIDGKHGLLTHQHALVLCRVCFRRAMTMSGDHVATWDVSLGDGKHKIEFEHGTISGKRIIRINKKEVLRRDWLFKLVGKESFTCGKAKCTISIDAVSGFAYEYSLEVNGKSLKKFSENQSKIMKTWVMTIQGEPTRVVLEKDTLDVWVNGERVETTGEFVDDGTETHFTIRNTHSAYIKAVSSGKRRDGLIHSLFVGEVEIPVAKE